MTPTRDPNAASFGSSSIPSGYRVAKFRDLSRDLPAVSRISNMGHVLQTSCPIAVAKSAEWQFMSHVPLT